MTFLDIIINNSDTREARLYGAAKRAAEKPDTGVTINIPAAYNVIKDSANMAVKYLPHYIFGNYADPFEALKGKFTKQDVAEFVAASHKDHVIQQLLTIILDEIGVVANASVSTGSKAIAANDPYGEYESYTTPTEPVKIIDNDPVTVICQAFHVTK